MAHFEDLNDCLIACVKAIGGSKQAGLKLWPEKTMEAAQRHLLNCLNDSKAERLAPEQVMLLARLARENGCHAYAEYVADQLSYAEPVPIEPRDEIGDLLRQYLQRKEEERARDGRLERLIAQHLAPAPKGSS
jgi:hypothetical protein